MYIEFGGFSRRFAKLRKRLSDSSCLSVCPSILMEKLGSHRADFNGIWLNIFRKSVEKIQVSLFFDKNNKLYLKANFFSLTIGPPIASTHLKEWSARRRKTKSTCSVLVIRNAYLQHMNSLYCLGFSVLLYRSTGQLNFRCDIPVVFYKLNTKYITSSQNTTEIIVLCCTICFTTTCFGPFL